MSAPKLSVLMTVRNGERHLEDTLRSVLEQTFVDFELLVVDDGSTDLTGDIIAEFARRDSRVIPLHNSRNHGIPKSINRLFGLARGCYLVRHDGDDLSAPERFARQVAFLESTNLAGLVAAQIRVIDEDGNITESTMFGGPGDNTTLQQSLLRHNCLCQGSVMFRRDLLEVVGIYDDTFTLSQDYDLWLRIAEVTEMVKLDEPLYFYRVHSSSVSSTQIALQVVLAAHALERAVLRRYGTNAPDDQKRSVAQLYLRAAVAHALVEAWDSAPRMLQRAHALDPHLFQSPQLLEDHLLGFTYREPVDTRVNSIRRVCNRLLATCDGAGAMGSSLIGRLHLAEVFKAAGEGRWAQVDRHLWRGLVSDPSWLVNWGVIVIAVKALIWRIGGAIRQPLFSRRS